MPKPEPEALTPKPEPIPEPAGIHHCVRSRARDAEMKRIVGECAIEVSRLDIDSVRTAVPPGGEDQTGSIDQAIGRIPDRSRVATAAHIEWKTHFIPAGAILEGAGIAADGLAVGADDREGVPERPLCAVQQHRHCIRAGVPYGYIRSGVIVEIADSYGEWIVKSAETDR